MPEITESNEPRYTELTLARPESELNDALNGFFKDVAELRVKHRLPDVHVIVRTIAFTTDGEETAGMSSAHFGAVQESEGMCGWAFAKSAEERRDFVDRMKTWGMKTAENARKRK